MYGYVYHVVKSKMLTLSHGCIVFVVVILNKLTLSSATVLATPYMSLITELQLQ